MAKIPYIDHAFLNKNDSASLQEPVTLKQIHSFEVVHVQNRQDVLPPADALVTTTPDVKLTLRTADCAPVLLADTAQQVIGAVHAGWKGALTGVIEATLIDMMALGARPETMVAAVGPCIHVDSYPIQPEMKKLFSENVMRFFPDYPGDEGHFNLPEYVVYRLKRSGLLQVDVLDVDTFTDNDYNSYRRDPLNPARQYSSIWIKPV